MLYDAMFPLAHACAKTTFSRIWLSLVEFCAIRPHAFSFNYQFSLASIISMNMALVDRASTRQQYHIIMGMQMRS